MITIFIKNLIYDYCIKVIFNQIIFNFESKSSHIFIKGQSYVLLEVMTNGKCIYFHKVKIKRVYNVKGSDDKLIEFYFYTSGKIPFESKCAVKKQYSVFTSEIQRHLI